jgi:phosphodiesterase/alkaline phosphatase D-like protein
LTIIAILLVLNWRTPAIAANASLSWDANTETDLAGYKVYYGTSSRTYGAPTDVGNQTTFTMTGLSEGQTYYFAVTAYNTSGSESAFSAEVSKTFPDTTPPVLSGMAAGSLTSTGAVITWTTNEAATAQVEYGTTTAYGSSSALRTNLLTSHSRSLSNLTPSTLYHYRVVSSDAAGNTATSGDNTFTTAAAPDTTPPAITGIVAGNLTPTSAAISWTTNELSDTQIQYGTTSAYGSSTALNATMTTTHSQGLTGLTGSTTYHYRVLSKDAAGNLATSGDNTFTTPAPPDTTAPTLSGITTSNLLSTSVVIAWSTNEGATSQVEYGTTTAYGASSALNTILVTSHARTLNNLSPSTTYHYRVISKDAADNIATSGDRTFTTPDPPDTTAPTLSGIAAGNFTSDSATINWTTNELADTQVQYGITTGYGSTTSLNSALTTSHTQGLTGLAASTTYHYRVLSRDAAGNLATSGDNTFTTPAPPDTTSPTLSGISAGSITSSSVTISWTTNESADTQVQYGTTTAYGSSTALNPTLTTAHSERLTGLAPSTLYHYRVLSKDATGNLATSGDNTFITPAPPDNTPPAFSGITASSLTSNSVAITWSTNEASTTQVEYGLTTAYGSLSALDATLVTNHTRTLSGLNPSTTYHFRVISKDAADNTATSEDNSFTTSAAPDTTAPVLSAITAGSVTATSATINWTTNEAATAQVEYGTTTAYGLTSALDNTLLTGHTRTLSNLTPSTTYHFRVISKDAADNTATSSDNTFTTPAPPDTTAPTLSGITAGNLTPSSATVSWTTNELSDAQIQYGTTTAYGSATSLNSALTLSHSQGLTGLSASTLYHYRVLSKDAAGNLAASGDNTFTTSAPPDTTPPILSAIAAENLTSNSVTVSWTTNEPADTQVQFGTTTSYGSTTSLNSALTTSHSQNFTGLTASTTYHFRVLSKDASGNLAVSGDNTFTTKKLSPGISRVAAKNISKNSATVSWTTDSAATSQVEYGAATTSTTLSAPQLTRSGISTPTDPSLVTEHNVTLNDLSPSTTYFFRVTSTDALGNTETSVDNFFTTAPSDTPADTTGPVLSQITVSDVRADRVTIGWGTDEPATTQVEYGLTPAYGHLTTLNATLMNSHSEILSGLQAETLYHYRVRSADAAGNLSLSEDRTFTTSALGDITPPADVENFTAVPGVQNVTLSWTNPSDSDFAGVRILYRTDRYPTDLNDGTLLGDFAGQPGESVTVLHAGLESNVTYYYSATSYDRSGNFQSTAHATATPLGIAESRSTSQGDGGASGGGCAMISPTDRHDRGPLDSAEWLGWVGLILVGLLRKRQK